MNRFTTDPIENDSCEDVPVLEGPSYQNKAQQEDGEQDIVYQNVDGDLVPVLEPPSYDHGRKIVQREQARTVTNDRDDDSDVPVLEPPSYHAEKDRR